MTLRMGIDLGATSAKIALVNSSLKVVKQTSVETSGFPRPAQLSRQLAIACRRLVANKAIHQLGVGVAGDIDSENGVVRVSPNLGWTRVPLKSLLEKELRCRVTVDNDANVAAWGIYKTEAPKGVTNLLVVTLGTGVGGGIILDGRLFRGTTGSAGEIGHMNIDVAGPKCNCGNRGCLETYVGGPHIVRFVREALENGQTSSLRKIFQEDPDQLTPYHITLAANKGDEFANSVWERVGHALGVALGDYIYLINPQMIYLTGGVAQAKALILKPLKQTLATRAFKTPIQAVKIKIGTQAAHIGVVGASLL